MRIHIVTMDDPLFTLDFFEDIIKARYKDITGITVVKGGRLKIGKRRSKFVYLLSLLIIMGPVFFIQNTVKTTWYKLKKKFSTVVPGLQLNTLESIAKQYNISIDYSDNPNSEGYLNLLKSREPDIIINQSQFILKDDFLKIPSIGVLNRHNALLPKNRGRLTPFWVLLKEEKETGVSIHFVEEGIDSGPIVVQRKFNITPKDTFRSIVEKNYSIASSAMLEAIDYLEKGGREFIPNNNEFATYNTVPTLREAIEFRKRRVF